MKKYLIEPIKNYPKNGKHQECYIGLPFQIRKGEDGYRYRNKKGVELKYNIYKSEKKIDDRWICHLKYVANESLEKIFEIKANKDLYVIIKYCFEIYKKSLELEIKRTKVELAKYLLNKELTLTDVCKCEKPEHSQKKK